MSQVDLHSGMTMKPRAAYMRFIESAHRNHHLERVKEEKLGRGRRMGLTLKPGKSGKTSLRRWHLS